MSTPTHFNVRDTAVSQSVLSGDRLSGMLRSPQSQMASEIVVPGWFFPLLVVLMGGVLYASYRTWRTAMFRQYVGRLERLWHSSLWE